jgi:thymidylate synthase
MQAYLDIVKKILDTGEIKDDRTGVGTIAIAGALFEHDMSMGFPLLTTKKMPFKVIASELEFFIKGITDKQWLRDRNNHIWDEWARPSKAPYGHTEEAKKKCLTNVTWDRSMVFNGDILERLMSHLTPITVEKVWTNSKI